MQELGILEILSGIFLFLPLLRPYIKPLWDLEGLVWLPVMALGIIVAVFPAYGFRPECFPLLLYAIVAVIRSRRSIIASITRVRHDDFREGSPVLAGFSVIILIGITAFTLYFLPLPDTILLTRGVRTINLQDPSRKAELFVRIYGLEEESGASSAEAQRAPGSGGGAEMRPFMLLIPPVTGSAGLMDRFCGSLRERGLTVMTYSRRGFDCPALDGEGLQFGLSADKWFRLFRAMLRGTVMEKANAAGRVLEEERKQDIVFLLTRLRDNRGFWQSVLTGTTIDHIFLTGYGAGGAALLLLSGSPDFTVQYPAVRGIIAVESPVLSVLRGEERPISAAPRDAGWFRSLWTGLSGWAAGFRPKKINTMTALPDPKVPVLFLVSGWALDLQRRSKRYETVFRVFDAATGPAVLAAIPGSQPQDYSDIPLKYPVFSIRLPGENPAFRQSDYFMRRTTALISNFTALIFEEMPDFRESPGSRISIPPKILFNDTIHIETGGAWNYQKKGYIL
ncbi:MAG: hypothetical protein LBD78_07515 [Spirochaetaceae bacterium]|jgi:hypothetical protein|nr:hypothetical protein [Spirochaetaceae bacterium]